MAKSDNRFLPESKKVLDQITDLISKEIPESLNTDLLVMLNPGIDIIKERLRSRNKRGDTLYDQAALEHMRSLYDDLYADFDKHKMRIQENRSPQEIANLILNKVKQM